jgi:hypothetical protein
MKRNRRMPAAVTRAGLGVGASGVRESMVAAIIE